jgi:monoamine oxidase
MRLCAIEPNTTPIICKFSKQILTADKLILAVPSEALKKISPFANLPALKHIQMTPLLRTYGVFKTNAEGQPWFADLHKTVTDSPLKFIIPVNASKGIIMTSYTDGEDTKPWTKILAKGEPALKNAIMTETRKLFPARTIPQPIYFKAHLWKNGCSYWTPGLYDPVAMGNKIMNPWDNLYVCGESYSQRQAWVEGALEHADALIHKFFQSP